jgi:hypothetical protein
MLVRVEDLDLNLSRSGVYSCSTLVGVIDPLKSGTRVDIDTNNIGTNNIDTNDIDTNGIGTDNIDTDDIDTDSIDTNSIDTNGSETNSLEKEGAIEVSRGTSRAGGDEDNSRLGFLSC